MTPLSTLAKRLSYCGGKKFRAARKKLLSMRVCDLHPYFEIRVVPRCARGVNETWQCVDLDGCEARALRALLT